MDVHTYFAQREREVADLSLYPDGGRFIDMCAATTGTDDQRGVILGRLRLTDNAYLKIDEVVIVQGKRVHRESYADFLVLDDEEVGGYERDPSHDPPVHKHTRGHERADAEPISFKEAVERAWHAIDPEAGDPQRFFG